MRRILLLEDHPAQRKEIEAVIASLEEQTEVISCGDRSDAYIHALEGEIDLFIVDIILKPDEPDDTSGLRFIENIRGITRYEFTPVIVLTCLEDLRSYSYERLHCYAYIEKPFDRGHFSRTVKACLRAPKPVERERMLYYRKEGIIIAIRASDVTHALVRDHKLYIYTRQKDEVMVPYVTLKRFLVDAGADVFLQISRSEVVNRSEVSRIDIPGRRIWLKNGESAEIGSLYTGAVRGAFALAQEKDI